MTIIMTVCLLGMVGGVYGIISNLTEVSIVIFIPDNFVKEVNFFINESTRIDFDISRKPRNTKVHLFGKRVSCQAMLVKPFKLLIIFEYPNSGT